MDKLEEAGAGSLSSPVGSIRFGWLAGAVNVAFGVAAAAAIECSRYATQYGQSRMDWRYCRLQFAVYVQWKRATFIISSSLSLVYSLCGSSSGRLAQHRPANEVRA